MSQSRSSRSSDTLQSSLLAITQTAVGCGIGLLLAGKLGRPARKTTAATLFSIGVLLALPTVVAGFLRIWNRPESERGSQQRLNSIRHDPGLSDESAIF